MVHFQFKAKFRQKSTLSQVACQLIVVQIIITWISSTNGFINRAKGLSRMTANVLNSWGAGLDSSSSSSSSESTKTADDPSEKLATYGMPYPSMNLAQLYTSNGQNPPTMHSMTANSMSQWPTMYGQSMNGGQFGNMATSMQTQSQFPYPVNGMDNFRRFGYNQMAQQNPMTGQMSTYSPMMMGLNQQFPLSNYGNYRPVMNMGLGMNMMDQGMYRPYASRRSGYRNRRFRSPYGRRRRRRPIDDEDDYPPYYKSSYHRSEDRYRSPATSSEVDYNNAIDSSSLSHNTVDHSPSSSENVYKVTNGLSTGNTNKEFLKIGGIGGNILSYLANSLFTAKSDHKNSDSIVISAKNSSKEISNQETPFVQFGSTKISLKRNTKGGITVTVGRLDN